MTMINIIDLDVQENIEEAVSRIRTPGEPDERVIEAVAGIIEAVREGGDRAVRELTLEFDGVEVGSDWPEVPASDAENAWDALPRETRAALESARERIASFARRGIPDDWESSPAPGITVGEMNRPLESAGLYVPGGRYAYPSSVLMTGVPASEAGVETILFCMPPRTAGEKGNAALAATRLVPGSRVFAIGGAQAVAAMAFGTETVPSCGVVAGPGNIYVATAKRLLSGTVRVDLEAGPSEIAVLMDGSTEPGFAAADVMAQMEHDPLSPAVLVSESEEVLRNVYGVIAGLAEGLGIEPGDLEGLFLVRCATRELAMGFLNRLAPEHLQLMVEDPEGQLEHIRCAGCVFLGGYSATAIGDYIAGPSHVLPTGGSARWISGLSVRDFMRTINVISYTKEALQRDAETARELAMLEGLKRHALSLDMRFRDEKGGAGADAQR